MRIGKFGQRHVFACLAQALDIGSAGRNWHVIVRSAMKEADRLVTYIRIVDVGREARRIERQIGAKVAPSGPCMRWKRLRLAYKVACPPRENPIRTIFAGSMRGCVESTARAR